jgi:hypothetical protein
MPDHAPPTISIIIKALDEEQHIAAAIESALAALADADGEVILADAASTDGTVAIAQAYPIRIVRLDKVEDRSCGAGAQLGFQYSRGEFLFLMDGDMRLHPDFVAAAIGFLRDNPTVAGVGGAVINLDVANLEYEQRVARFDPDGGVGAVTRLGGCGLYRRSAIEALGYVTDRNLHGGEELDLGARLHAAGWTLARIDHPAVEHYCRAGNPYWLLWQRVRTRNACGPGEVIRAAIGRPQLGFVLRNDRNSQLCGLVAVWWVAIAALAAAAGGPIALFAIAALLALPFTVMAVRWRSLRNALYSIAVWNAQALCFLPGLLRSRKAPAEWIDSTIVSDPTAAARPARPVATSRADRLALLSTRRVVLVLGLLFCATAWLSGMARTVGAIDQNSFRRGIGIGHVMAWAAIAPGPAREFVFPPFADVNAAEFATELQALQRTGFDFVRLAVDPGPFLQFQGERRDALDRMLVERVNQALTADLGVIVDFHPSDMHPDYTAAALTTGATDPLFESYVRLIERTAGLLDGLHSPKVALELMNEPPLSPQAWQPLLDAAYAAARRGSARVALVVEGGNEASAAALFAMRTATLCKDVAVLFSFHYYDPYQFTHQGASWNAARYLADVPYPARARPLGDSLTASATLIGTSALSAPRQAQAYRDAQVRLEQYRESGFDRATVAKEFERIADWARRQGIASDRIMLGEFGARQTALQLSGARASERAQWFRDVRQAAEAQNFSWAAWVYRGQGFGLAPEPGTDLEPNIADALGLNSTVTRKSALSVPAH